MNKTRGFTLIEFLIIAVVIGILAVIAIPRVFNYTDIAKTTAIKSILVTTRTSISSFILKNIATTGNASLPTLIELNTLNTVLDEPLLPNPYNDSNTIRDASGTYDPNDPPIDTISGDGWNYDELSGKFWTNTNVNGEKFF